MGKKTDITKPAPSKRAAKAPPAAEKISLPDDAAKPRKAVSTKSKTTAARSKIASAKKPAFTREEVALRAYFIAEKRHATGAPGNEHQDWMEAERQLTAESRRSKAKA